MSHLVIFNVYIPAYLGINTIGKLADLFRQPSQSQAIVHPLPVNAVNPLCNILSNRNVKNGKVLKYR